MIAYIFCKNDSLCNYNSDFKTNYPKPAYISLKWKKTSLHTFIISLRASKHIPDSTHVTIAVMNVI